MKIDFIVPACTNKKDYLRHPDCDATKVRDLFLEGLCINDIARSLDASFALQERLQTAVEVHQRDGIQLKGLLISDAVSVLERLKPERLSATAKLYGCGPRRGRQYG